jgi:hypothetical protein
MTYRWVELEQTSIPLLSNEISKSRDMVVPYSVTAPVIQISLMSHVIVGAIWNGSNRRVGEKYWEMKHLSLEKESSAMNREIITTISEVNTSLIHTQGEFGVFSFKKRGHVSFSIQLMHKRNLCYRGRNVHFPCPSGENLHSNKLTHNFKW